MEETWKMSTSYPTMEASDRGRVRTAATKRVRKAKPHEKLNYLRVNVQHNGHRKTVYVHQIVADAFYGPCPDGREVCHNDGNSLNNTPGNLRYDTHVRNAQERHEHKGRSKDWSRCSRGHSLRLKANVYVRSTPGAATPTCKACNKARDKNTSRRKQGLPPLSNEEFKDYANFSYQSILNGELE